MKKEDKPLLSVIVAIYNTIDLLDQCVESIVSQSYKNLQIILVDDGSYDGTGNKCDEWAKKDRRIEVVHKTNEGLTRSRQIGVSFARGEYVIHMDGDDWIEPDMYEYMMNKALKYNADIVTSGLIRDYGTYQVYELDEFAEGFYDRTSMIKNILPNMVSTEVFYDARINIHITNKIFKRELLNRQHLRISTKIDVGEDVAIVYPCLLEANSIFITNKLFYHYVLRANSILGTKSEKVNDNKLKTIAMLSELLSYIEDKYIDIIPNIKEQFTLTKAYCIMFLKPQKLVEYSNDFLYPFEGKIHKKEKVVVYGKGRFGKSLIQVLQQEGYVDVVAWIDKNNILTQELHDILYDKIIIGAIDSKVLNDILKDLTDAGIPKERMCKVDIGMVLEIMKDIKIDN